MKPRGHAVALLAVAWLGVMYVAGELPRHRHFHRATQDGGLLASSPGEIRQIEVQAGATLLRALREGDAWRFEPVPVDPAATTAKLTRALQFLKVSPPVRALGLRKSNDPLLAQAALLAPSLELRIDSGAEPVQALVWGGTAPDGILRYVRDAGSGKVFLVSGFVAAAWEDLVRTWKSGASEGYNKDTRP